LSVGLTEDQTTFVIFGSLIFANLAAADYGALPTASAQTLLIFFCVAGTLGTDTDPDDAEGNQVALHGFLADCAAWIFVAGYTSINAIVKANCSHQCSRARRRPALSDPRCPCSAATAPAVALYLRVSGTRNCSILSQRHDLLSLIIYATMRDTKHESAMHRHEYDGLR